MQHNWDCILGIPDCLFLSLLGLGTPWCCLSVWPRFTWSGIPTMIIFGYTISGISCGLQGYIILIVCGEKGERLDCKYLRSIWTRI